MAAEARRVRATWPLGPIALAVLEADKENAFAVIRNSLSAEFRSQLHPNVLLNAAPWVAIWCVGEKADQMDITRLVQEMHGIKDLAESPIVVYSDAMPLLALPKGVLWIVSNAASTLAHSPEIRGRATCAHLLTSWEVYCREGAHDPRSVLGLGFDYAIHDLGIGYDAPDLEHHSAKLGELLSRELKKQWGSSSHPVAPPSFGQLGEIVDRVLEKTPYVTSSEKSEDNPAIRTAQQSVIMRMRTKRQETKLPASATRQTWQNDRGNFAEFESYLRVSHFLSFDTRSGAEARRVAAELMLSWRGYLSTPEKANGAIDELLKKVEHAKKHYLELDECQGKVIEDLPILQASIKEIDQAVLRIAAPEGVALRILLIGIGVAWLSFGTFFWDKSASPFTSNLLRWVLFGGVSGLVLIGLMAWGQIYYATEVVKRLLAKATSEIKLRHLNEICPILTQRIHEIGATMVKSIQSTKDQLDKLKQIVSAPLEGEKLKFSANRNPKFGTLATERVWGENKDRLIEIAHDIAKKALTGQDGLHLNGTVWLTEGRLASQAAVKEVIDRVSYEKWCEYELDDNARRTLLTTIFADSSIRSTEGLGDSSEPIYIGPRSFTQLDNQLDRYRSDNKVFRLRHPELPWLIIVRPIPLLESEITTEI